MILSSLRHRKLWASASYKWDLHAYICERDNRATQGRNRCLIIQKGVGKESEQRSTSGHGSKSILVRVALLLRHGLSNFHSFSYVWRTRRWVSAVREWRVSSERCNTTVYWQPTHSSMSCFTDLSSYCYICIFARIGSRRSLSATKSPLR